MSGLAFVERLLRDPVALVIVKATIVLALASGAAAVAKPFSAARRHMLWLVALSSCVWLVVSSPVVPAIVIHTPALAPAVATTAPTPAVDLPSTSAATLTHPSPSRDRSGSARGAQHASHRPMPLPANPLIALWVVGCVVLFARQAVGVVGAVRLTRRATIASDADTLRELAAAGTAVGVRRRIHLGYSADVESPITLGVARPFVLLPAEARSWTIERRRAVLVHEAAHIARGDWLAQSIGRLACDLFWFHPLVWFAFMRLRDEAECAADDCVLRSGMPAFDYATHLLELARRPSTARANLAAVGIVTTNSLERRFVAMFDAGRSRAAVTSRVRAITSGVALAMICVLASLRIASPAPLHAATISPAQHAIVQHSVNVVRPASRAARRAIVVAGVPPVHLTTTAARPIAVVAASTPRAAGIVRPDLSGKWTQDTVAGPVDESGHVTDSTIITQSVNAISFDSRGHIEDTPTHNRFLSLPFDGKEVTGVAGTTTTQSTYDAKALWLGDTLVLITHIWTGSGHQLRTFERMTLSADGQTLFIANSSFADGNIRLGIPQTFVLRRMAR